MHLGSDFYFTCLLLYMFRALLASEFISCHVGRWLSNVHSYQGLHIQLYTPDDGCKKHPKHVE